MNTDSFNLSPSTNGPESLAERRGMQITTAFRCGDKAWVFLENYCQEVTVGQIRITYTKSEGDPDSMFSNYKPQEGYEEVYMCEETGIGSGNLYTLGKHIFHTKEECEKANADNIARIEKEKAERRAYELKEARNRLASVRLELARLERQVAASA